MDFLSRSKSPSFVFRHGHPRMVDGAGNVTQAARRSAIIKFEEAAKPYPTRKLSGKDNLAYGKLRVKKVLSEFHQIGYRDVTEQDIRDFLTTHPDHGREFVFVGGELEASTANYLLKEPDNSGNLYCTLCDQHNIAARGKAGHENSKRHRALLEAEVKADAEMFGVIPPEPEVDIHVPDVSG